MEEQQKRTEANENETVDNETADETTGETKEETSSKGEVTGTGDVHKKYRLIGKKLTQQEIDLIVLRYKKERKKN